MSFILKVSQLDLSIILATEHLRDKKLLIFFLEHSHLFFRTLIFFLEL